MAQAGNGTVLKPDQLQELLPATVYYSGQTASVQLRNAGGVRFSDGHYVLARLVDTSGYSSNVAAKYQGYLITEVPLTIAGKRFAAGAYGIGFVSGDRRTHAEITSESVPWHIHRQAAFEPEPRQYSRPWDAAGHCKTPGQTVVSLTHSHSNRPGEPLRLSRHSPGVRLAG